jgi:hypothetical protein
VENATIYAKLRRVTAGGAHPTPAILGLTSGERQIHNCEQVSYYCPNFSIILMQDAGNPDFELEYDKSVNIIR